MAGSGRVIRAVFFDVDFTLIFPGPAMQGPGYERFCVEHGITGVDADRFDTAVAASSFILDEVEGRFTTMGSSFTTLPASSSTWAAGGRM